MASVMAAQTRPIDAFACLALTRACSAAMVKELISCWLVDWGTRWRTHALVENSSEVGPDRVESRRGVQEVSSRRHVWEETVRATSRAWAGIVRE